MAFLDLDGLETFLSGCDNRYAPKTHSHTQYLNMEESRTANTVLAGPNGSAGVATFRKLVADDIPSISKSKISDFPSSMPASDVYSWAKAASKPSYNFSEISGQVNAGTQLTGKIPSGCLPSYVDDVLEYEGLAKFPTEGETGKIYTDTTTNKIYRWGGSKYVVISDSLALGTTSSTAYQGDLGAEAHSWALTAKAHADKHGSAYASGLYKITTNDAGHVTGATAVTKSDITALGIPGADTHYTSNLIVGTSSSAVANSATANGTTFLNLVENGSVRNSHQIKGAGATTVSTDSQTTNSWRDCIDNLTSTATDQSLSANQGRILNEKFASYVPTSRTVNNKALTSNIVLTASDVGASAVGHEHNYAGSSTPGGAATSANKLNTNAGGTTTPVYFSNGVPVACTPYSDASVSYATKANEATCLTGGITGNRSGQVTTSSWLCAFNDDKEGEIRAISPKNLKAVLGVDKVDNTADSDKSVKYATSAGSANSATTATTATQLSSSAGSATNPIYFSNGKPTACTFSLNKTVPSDAVFTDTWRQLTGSTTSFSGVAGYAPAPEAGASDRYLRCDGKWVVPPNTSTDTKYYAGAGLSLSGTTFSLSSSGVTSGSYGPSANVNGTNGTTISVPQITVDSYGRVTSLVNRTYTSVNTDTNTTYSAIPEATINGLFA